MIPHNAQTAPLDRNAKALARQVESHGRVIQAYRAGALCLGVTMWFVFLWWDTHPPEGQSFYQTSLFWVVLGASAVLGMVFFVRLSASRTFDDQARRLGATEPTDAGGPTVASAKVAQSPQPELIICCSGGGIKSASFCLGGLEQLFYDGFYHRAESVIAVSGGSYTAAAFALHRADQTADDIRELFAAGTGAARSVLRATAHLQQLSHLKAGRNIRSQTIARAENAAKRACVDPSDIAPHEVRSVAQSASAAAREGQRALRSAKQQYQRTMAVASWTKEEIQQADVVLRKAALAMAEAKLLSEQASQKADLILKSCTPTRGRVAPANSFKRLDWVPPIRRLTNYFVSSPRVRSELIMRWLTGVAIALFILGLMLTFVAWLVTELATYNGFVPDPAASLNRDGRSWWRFLLPSLLLCVTPVISFAWSWIRRQPTISRPWRPDPKKLPKFSHRDEFKAWFGDLPPTLFKVGCFYALTVLAVPLAARLSHEFAARDLLDFLNEWYGKVAAVVVAIGTYTATLRSAFKGWQTDAKADSIGGQAIAFVRRSIAPIIALLLFFFFVFLTLTILTALMLAEPHQWLIGAGALILLFVIQVIGRGTITSLYPFYRDRLQAAYLTSTRSEAPLLSWLERVPGEPRLVLCATANVRDENLLPTGRLGTPFLLGDQIGTTDATFTQAARLLSAREYEEGMAKRSELPAAKSWVGDRRRKAKGGGANTGKLTLADAVAISGAALAPVLGRDSKTIGRYRMLLALANIRLGAWLPNPYWMSSDIDLTKGGRAGSVWLDDWLNRSSLFQVVKEAVGTPSLYSPLLYVTDGGHFDNLGIVEALRRRPRFLIMLDGSGDAEDAFPAMGMAMATARIDLDINVDFDPAPMTRGTKQNPPRGWVKATAEHRATKETTQIIYIKSVLPAGLSWDLDSYRARTVGFPATAQKYETFDEFDFEAYHQLGSLLAAQATKDLVIN